jgi:hypothetical protein
MLCLYVIFQFGINQARNEISVDKVVEAFKQRDPINFWRTIAGKKSLNGLKVHHVINILEKQKAEFGLNEQTSFDAVTGVLYFRQGFLDAAERKLRHVVSTSRSESELRQSLAILAEIYQTRRNSAELEKVRVRLETIDPRFRLHYMDLSQPRNSDLPERGFFKLYLLLVWLVLLSFPTILIEFERRNWLKRFAQNKDLRGPFLAFNRSNFAGFLIVLSAILFLLLKFPGNIGLSGKNAFLALHIALSWLLCQLPFYSLAKKVKPEFSLGFSDFVIAKFRTILFLSGNLIALAVSVSIVHFMVINLPFWALKRPFSAVLSLPSIFTLLLVIIHFSIPYFMLAKKLKPGQLSFSQRVFTVKKALRVSWLEYGAFSFLNTTLLTGNILEKLDQKELDLILKRSSQKLKDGSGFEEFLLLFNLILISAIYFAFDPLRIVRFFSLGPTFAEAATFLLFVILGGYVLSVRQRSAELEADDFIARQGGSEELIDIYSKLNKTNFLPEKYREGDAGIFAPVSLNERKENIRAGAGEYFYHFSQPEGQLLISLWRSRLAIEWKLGIEEAVFITSLDYQVNEESPEDELRAMAEKHAVLGSESVYYTENRVLEVIYCAQKACAFLTEETLPHAKICRVCSKAMLKSLHRADYHWTGTEKGCRLKIKKSED